MAETKFTGSARAELPYGGEYSGELVEGKPHGYGVMRFPNGDLYEGEWIEGEMDGLGEYFIYDMQWGSFTKKYKGEFSKCLRHGKGCMIYEDFSKYQGNWQNNQRTGHGVCWFANGDRFLGIWKFDQMLRGVYSIAESGDLYDGEIKDGVFEGCGKYYWKSGNLFEGTFMRGKPHNGILILSDGKMTEIVEGEVR